MLYEMMYSPLVQYNMEYNAVRGRDDAAGLVNMGEEGPSVLKLCV